MAAPSKHTKTSTQDILDLFAEKFPEMKDQKIYQDLEAQLKKVAEENKKTMETLAEEEIEEEDEETEKKNKDDENDNPKEETDEKDDEKEKETSLFDAAAKNEPILQPAQSLDKNKKTEPTLTPQVESNKSTSSKKGKSPRSPKKKGTKSPRTPKTPKSAPRTPNGKNYKANDPIKYAKTAKREITDITLSIRIVDSQGQNFWGSGSRNVKVKLFKKKRKKTVDNFLALCGLNKNRKGLEDKNAKGKKKYYCYKDDTKHLPSKGIFHRVDQPNGIIQGGDVINRDGTGNVSIYGKFFKNENDEKDFFDHAPYVLSMANLDENKNSCQFFFTTKYRRDLNGKHCVFGCVTEKSSQAVLNDILVDAFPAYIESNNMDNALTLLDVIAKGTPTNQIHIVGIKEE